MPEGSCLTSIKARLSIALLVLQFLAYLYLAPRGTPRAPTGTPPQHGYPLEKACDQTYPLLHTRQLCPAGQLYFKEVGSRCGLGSRRDAARQGGDEGQDSTEPAPEGGAEESDSGEPPSTAAPPPTEAAPVKPAAQEVKAAKEKEKEKPGHLIYQVIVVLLFVSVSFALADCFQERAKRKNNSDCGGRVDGLGSRRMSLADLTMSRHARKESQASYRPVGEKRPLLATRSCSQDVPKKSKAVTRQTSCPQLEDDPAYERRRVRMIQRH